MPPLSAPLPPLPSGPWLGLPRCSALHEVECGTPERCSRLAAQGAAVGDRWLLEAPAKLLALLLMLRRTLVAWELMAGA